MIIGSSVGPPVYIAKDMVPEVEIELESQVQRAPSTVMN